MILPGQSTRTAIRYTLPRTIAPFAKGLRNFIVQLVLYGEPSIQSSLLKEKSLKMHSSMPSWPERLSTNYKLTERPPHFGHSNRSHLRPPFKCLLRIGLPGLYHRFIRSWRAPCGFGGFTNKKAFSSGSTLGRILSENRGLVKDVSCQTKPGLAGSRSYTTTVLTRPQHVISMDRGCLLPIILLNNQLSSDVFQA